MPSAAPSRKQFPPLSCVARVGLKVRTGKSVTRVDATYSMSAFRQQSEKLFHRQVELLRGYGTPLSANATPRWRLPVDYGIFPISACAQWLCQTYIRSTLVNGQV